MCLCTVHTAHTQRFRASYQWNTILQSLAPPPTVSFQTLSTFLCLSFLFSFQGAVTLKQNDREHVDTLHTVVPRCGSIVIQRITVTVQKESKHCRVFAVCYLLCIVTTLKLTICFVVTVSNLASISVPPPDCYQAWQQASEHK